MAFFITKSDSIGILSSSLCLIHCLATPFLFAAQAHIVSCCDSKPLWWSSIDFIFLVVSAIAIHRTVKTTTRHWVKTAFWINWFVLLILIVNEKMDWFHFPESSVYVPAFSLIMLHVYNSKFCQCKNEECCTSTVFK